MYGGGWVCGEAARRPVSRQPYGGDRICYMEGTCGGLTVWRGLSGVVGA